jgi:hypothetical protein
MNYSSSIARFKNLPDGLCKSNYIDLLLFLCGLKPAVRFILTNPETKQEMILWCNENKFHPVFQENRIIYISKNAFFSCIVRFVDNMSCNHEYLLGLLLGYPRCCCKKISSVGEGNIDVLEKIMSNPDEYCDEFKLINPAGYTAGLAYISHIPCSTKCKKSLKIAKIVSRVVCENKSNRTFAQWESIGDHDDANRK